MKKDLTVWISEILAGAWAHQNETTGLLPNYFNSTAGKFI
jgi:hypothetical protein